MRIDSATSRRRRRTASVAAAALTAALIPIGGAAQAATPTASPTPAPVAAAAHRLHVARTEHLHGSKGRLTFDVTVPVLAGTGAAAKIDRRLRDDAWATIDGTAKEPGDAHELTGRDHVSTDDGRTVQVVTGYADYFDGAAHPTDTVRTVALTARTGAPIPFTALFTHRERALVDLGRVVERLAAKAGDPVTEPSGLAPTASDWSAWQTTRKGFVIRFQDYQLGGHGVRTYTLPWRDVLPLLTKHARTLLAPKR